VPELPDILLYVSALTPRVRSQPLTGCRIISPFVLRTFDPPIDALLGRPVESVSRLGKRIVWYFGDLALITHLMISGRYQWYPIARKPPPKPSPKITLATFTFPTGTLHLIESSPKKRAGLWLVRTDDLAAHTPSGIDVLSAAESDFASRLRSENHTLKRALTDPRLFDGIGNAYSDEILHAARLSPVTLTSRLADEEIARLHDAARITLTHWIARLRSDYPPETTFPSPAAITAFRPDFAAHGRFGKPCPVCSTPIQRIRYAENETNYCPRCQTGGKLLADRSLSLLL
jgi:formamidopyrimidine-DNA glycosylase